MPLGNRVWLGTRLPLESRAGSAQQSSMFTYLYPADLSPSDTNESAMPRIVVSLNVLLQWVVFQLLKPIGGVRARPFSRAAADVGWSRSTVTGTAPIPVASSSAVSVPRILR